MKVKIKNKEIELKFSIRAMIMYENIEDKTFAPQNFTDILTFFYCVVLSSSNDYSLTFDEFINILDENPKYLTEFKEWLDDVNNVQNQLKKK